MAKPKNYTLTLEKQVLRGKHDIHFGEVLKPKKKKGVKMFTSYKDRTHRVYYNQKSNMIGEIETWLDSNTKLQYSLTKIVIGNEVYTSLVCHINKKVLKTWIKKEGWLPVGNLFFKGDID